MLTTGDLVRSHGNLVTQITDSMLNPFMIRASYTVKKLFSDYTDIETDLAGTPVQRSLDIQLGETYLALAYALPALNQRASVEGGFVQSIGFNDSETRLYTPSQILDLSAHYKQEAYNNMASYIDADSDETDDDDNERVSGALGFEVI